MIVDTKTFDILRGLRLQPMESCLDGYIVWCKGTKCRGISAPGKRTEPPPEADTAVLSVSDYREITAAIADGKAE